jgi:type I restriction enzyme, S subunit
LNLQLSSEISSTIRRWKPYHAYTDSGIELLGEIPAHWEISLLRRKLKNGSDGIKIGPFGSQLKLEYMQDSGFKVYGQEHVIANDFSLGLKYVGENKFRELAACQIQPGDLLITMMGTSGRCQLVPSGVEPGIMDSHLLRLRVQDNDIDPRFAALVLDKAKYVEDQLQTMGKGAIMHGLNSSLVKSIVFAIPPPSEQQMILAFLDRETAKIDALVAKKEWLIELLQEKRAALITCAVTRGLPSTGSGQATPNVPMRDSGVEWLGEIPAHWDLWSVRNLIRKGLLQIQDGNHGELHPTAVDYVSEGIPFLMANDVRQQRINLTSCKFITKELADSLRIGFSHPCDVLLTHKGTIGETAVVPNDPPFPYLMLTPQVTYYRSRSTRLMPRYLCYLFQSGPFKEQLTAMSLQQSTRDYVGITAQRELLVVLPESSEQEQLVEYFDHETCRIDDLIAKIREGIEKLKEYRTALISAAVTGKIDIRTEILS